MSQFLKVKTAEQVLEIIAQFDPLGTETVAAADSCGRVAAETLRVPEPLPHFARATMDGYAVRARDTFGASESLPALLQVCGEVRMGEIPPVAVGPGTAVAIATGGALPQGADAVVMVEYSQPLDERTVEITRPVAPGDNVLDIGEDLEPGEVLLDRGQMLRPQDAGVLTSLGVKWLKVYRRPRAAVISTGDEIVDPTEKLLPVGKIRDINSTVLRAQARAAGADVTLTAIVGDRLDSLVQTCRRAAADHDILILSGGSSVGNRDYTLRILDQFPDAQLLVHGVAIRPGKPTILARMGDKIFCGLPGQPASAMIVFTAFVRPLLARLQGMTDSSRGFHRTCRAVLERSLPSVHGRADYVRVALSETSDGYRAMPIFGSSAMMSTLIRADGYVIVPEHVEGYEQGRQLTVYLFADL